MRPYRFKNTILEIYERVIQRRTLFIDKYKFVLFCFVLLVRGVMCACILGILKWACGNKKGVTTDNGVGNRQSRKVQSFILLFSLSVDNNVITFRYPFKTC